jgi:hypothetical protein
VVNQGIGANETKPYTFTVGPASVRQRISTMGVSGSALFHNITDQIVQGTSVARAKETRGTTGTLGADLDLALAPGDYTYFMSVDAAQPYLGVQYHSWNAQGTEVGA